MLAPTTIDFCADETATGGTDKSVPYMVRCKTQQRTYVTRSTYGFLHCPESGHRRYMYP